MTVSPVERVCQCRGPSGAVCRNPLLTDTGDRCSFCAACCPEGDGIDWDARVSRALSNHWVTLEKWGGKERKACGHCAYMDGVRRLWPCPTVVALTGCEPPDPRPSVAEAVERNEASR